MNQCERCGSCAVNPGLYGRPLKNDEENLCDVCYWRKRAEAAEVLVEALMSIREAARADGSRSVAAKALAEYKRRLME